MSHAAPYSLLDGGAGPDDSKLPPPPPGTAESSTRGGLGASLRDTELLGTAESAATFDFLYEGDDAKEGRELTSGNGTLAVPDIA